jgi:hypothetical protein
MKLTVQIDSDCKCMERYFHKLLHLLKESQEEEALTSIEVHDANADESLAKYHGFSHLIKPDMVINIYSLVDYWINQICEHQRKCKNLSLTAKDIKGDGELDARHKYLTKYAALKLDEVKDSYIHLDQLRMVRNKYIHGGGHINSKEETKFSAIDGIVIFGSLIVIKEDFIWSQLGHAKKYLLVAARA